MEGTGPKRPCYSCPDLKDDVVEELIDRCDVITSASMAGSFKTILNSTNNIITRNPRVKERFDLPYLICRDPDCHAQYATLSKRNSNVPPRIDPHIETLLQGGYHYINIT